MANRYVESWMRQAEHDLESAQGNFGLGSFDTCVVLCQQAVEKALKALHIAQHGELAPKTHSLKELAELTSMSDDLDRAVFKLGEDYFKLRYPDDAGRAPFERCTREHGEEALAAAERALAVIRRRVAEEGERSGRTNPDGGDGLLPELPETPPIDIATGTDIDARVRRFLEKYLDRLRELYDPVQLWVFGSRVQGEPDRGSDIDLLIVSERFREVPRDRRRSTFREQTGIFYDSSIGSVDPLCYTPEEFEHGKRAPCIIREAVRHGVRVA